MNISDMVNWQRYVCKIPDFNNSLLRVYWLKDVPTEFKLNKILGHNSIYIQLPLGSFRNFDVTHSRLVTHFRILKNQNKIFTFLILHKLNLLYIFSLIFFYVNTPLYILWLCNIMFHDLLINISLYLSISEVLLAIRDCVN